MQRISVKAQSDAAPERVWALLANTSSWAEWAPFDAAELESEGDGEPDGVGAVRRLHSGRRTTRERVVTFEPPRRFAYELVSGVPISDYRAEVTLEPGPDGGTSISWESRFRGKFPVPATLVRRPLERFIGDTVEALARSAEAPISPDSGG